MSKARRIIEMSLENPWEEAYEDYLRQHLRYLRDAGNLLGVEPDLINSHDDSKWSEEEFSASARHHKGDKGDPEAYARAWLHHVHNNPHHWQHWMFPDEFDLEGAGLEGGTLPIPEPYVREMVADWMSSSRTFTDSWDMTDWLKENLPEIKLHSNTKEILKGILVSLGYEEIAEEYL